MDRAFKKNALLWVSFLHAFFALLFLPHFLPMLRLFYFIPHLVIVSYKRTLYATLWHAFLCGIILDLFSTSSSFGLIALTYCLTVWIPHPLTRIFFEEKPFTIPLVTLFFSCISTFFQALLLSFFGQTFPISWMWILSDFCLMPLLDAAYSILCFSLPFSFYRQVSKILKYATIRNRTRSTSQN